MDVGLYGKLPSHGDFLRRRVSEDFVDGWDAWLQQCMAASREALGNRWLDVYLTSPVWCFACAARACGSLPVFGLMVPSVDRVGRYFPLTLVATLPESVNVISAANETRSFFHAAERLVVETLATEDVDFEAFDARVVALRDELATVALPRRLILEPTAAALVDEGAPTGWQIPIGGPGQLNALFEQLLSLRLGTLYDPLTLWWTDGSSAIEPSCLIGSGLPHPDTFAALLDGSWARHQWVSVSARVEPAPGDTLLTTAPLRFRSAAATDVGRVRDINQDAFVERPEVGLWAVADGLGGHRDGEIASRMVCDALADFDPVTSFEATVDAARERIYQVNGHLLRSAMRPHLAERSGSTVVVLLVRGTSCAILWAGDSRVYRWRDGRLERLTRDHSLAESGRRAGLSESHVVTRAVGVQPDLELDLYRDDVRPGDRFLLCSDGLTHTLSDTQIGARMEDEDIRAAVAGLIGATLEAGAPDNVTAVIVEACSAA